MEIIAVQPAENIAGCLSKAFIDRCSLPPVSRGTPEAQPPSILLQDLNRPVGTSTIEDRELEVGVILVEYAWNRSFNEGSLILRWSDD
jgi:hypothetical protein